MFADFSVVEQLEDSGTLVVLGGGGPVELTDDGLFDGMGGFGTLELGEFGRVALGDVNADGLADFGVFGDKFGEAFLRVVFGKPDTMNVFRSDIQMGLGGFEIAFADDYVLGAWLGENAVAGEDFDGDGETDLVFTASSKDKPEIVVMRGGPGPPGITLAELKDAGRIRTIDGPSGLGSGLAFVPDVSQDQRAELLIGSSWEMPNAVYLVFGTAETEPMELEALLSSGGALRFVLDDPAPFGSAIPVHAAELTGDGIVDLVIGAPTSSPGGIESAGRLFVISGAALPSLF